MHHTPHTGSLALQLDALLALPVLLGPTEQLVDFGENFLVLLSTAGIKLVLHDVVFDRCLLHELRSGLVALARHDKELGNEDEHGNEKISQEPALQGDLADFLVQHPVQQEDCGAGVESPGEHRKDETGPARERVGEVERRDEDERAADGQQEIGYRICWLRLSVHAKYVPPLLPPPFFFFFFWEGGLLVCRKTHDQSS